MGMAPVDKELHDIERVREVRHQIYKSGGFPFREKAINPEKIQGAADYGNWLKRRASFTLDQLAHHDMLKHEENVLSGNVPPEVYHDRRAGRSEVEQPAPSETSSAPRTNRLSAQCAMCHESIAPGQGIVERTPDGYVTRHRNH